MQFLTKQVLVTLGKSFLFWNISIKCVHGCWAAKNGKLCWMFVIFPAKNLTSLLFQENSCHVSLNEMQSFISHYESQRNRPDLVFLCFLSLERE